MSWTWRYETAEGEHTGDSDPFDSRGDAETWLGETFDELRDDGVDQVVLLDGDTHVYGPMGLHPAQ